MITSKKSILFSLLLSALIISCQKEVDDFGTIVNPPAPTNDSIYLDKMYELYDDGTGLDTVAIIQFSYDAQKRITKWSITDVLTGPYIDYNYYYNGTDTIPFKTLFIDYDPGTPDTILSFHTYDASGKNLQDSSLISRPSSGSNAIEIFNYSYAPGKRFGDLRKENLQPTTSVYFYRDTASIDASGNIVSIVRYTDEITGNMELYSNANYTYDNKINPFSRQNIFKAHQQAYSNEESLFYEYMPFNNMMSHIETITPVGSSPLNENFTWTYNSNNLPVKSVLVNGTDTSVLLYTYRQL
jgi:hypothetical protein